MTFDVAAEAYDRFMGRWSAGLTAQLADLAGVRAGQRVLDVGCGPGALTAELAARVGAASVEAVDPSASFVAAARARNPGTTVHLAAAEALPFPDEAFDAALAQLVVHFMADPVAGLSEMARVTRPGGVVAACVWDYAGGRHPLWPFWEAAAQLDPAAPGESLRAGAQQGQLTELAREAGLRDPVEHELTSRRAFAGFADWWSPFEGGVGPAGAYVRALSPDRRTALRERCRSMLPDGPFEATAVAWAVCATA